MRQLAKRVDKLEERKNTGSATWHDLIDFLTASGQELKTAADWDAAWSEYLGARNLPDMPNSWSRFFETSGPDLVLDSNLKAGE